jgi:hypothetical protein
LGFVLVMLAAQITKIPQSAIRYFFFLISPQRLSSRDLHYHGAMEDAAAR